MRVWLVSVSVENVIVCLHCFKTKELAAQWLVDYDYLVNVKQFEVAHKMFNDDYIIIPNEITQVRVCERDVVDSASVWS